MAGYGGIGGLPQTRDLFTAPGSLLGYDPYFQDAQRFQQGGIVPGGFADPSGYGGYDPGGPEPEYVSRFSPDFIGPLTTSDIAFQNFGAAPPAPVAGSWSPSVGGTAPIAPPTDPVAYTTLQQDMAGRTGAPPTPDVYGAEAALAAQGAEGTIMGALKTGVGSLMSPFGGAIGAIGAKGQIDAANRTRQMNLPPELYEPLGVVDSAKLVAGRLGKDAPFTPQDIENMRASGLWGSDLGATMGAYNIGDTTRSVQVGGGPASSFEQPVTPRQIDLSNVHPSNREYYQDLLEGQAAYAAAEKKHLDEISRGLAFPELSPEWVRASLKGPFSGLIDPSAYYGEIDEGRDRGTLSAQDLGLRGDETEWDLYFNALQPGYQKTYDYDAQGYQEEAEDRAKAQARAAYDWQALGPGDISDPTIRSVQGTSWMPSRGEIVEAERKAAFNAQRFDPNRGAKVTVSSLPQSWFSSPVTVSNLAPVPTLDQVGAWAAEGWDSGGDGGPDAGDVGFGGEDSPW